MEVSVRGQTPLATKYYAKELRQEALFTVNTFLFKIKVGK